MKAATVVQFANWLNVISSDISELKGNLVNEDRTINRRLYKLGMWVLEQADKRGALDMSIDDFMARCPASVRAAKAELKALRAAAAKTAAREE